MKHTARKRFGQNFLTDQNIINNIIAAINPQKDQNIVEIGPGLGAITAKLLKAVTHLNVIEIDRDLVNSLTQQYGDKLTIHSTDVLKFDFSCLDTPPWRIVGNLPYNISTPLLFYLLNYADKITDMHFMLQKEVVDRICAQPNSKDYGRLTVILQYYCQVTSLFTVPNTAFKPQPKVASAILRLQPYRKKPHLAKNEATFATIVKTAFMHRRKTIANNLASLISADAMQMLDINPKARPETLTVADYVRIANAVAE